MTRALFSRLLPGLVLAASSVGCGDSAPKPAPAKPGPMAIANTNAKSAPAPDGPATSKSVPPSKDVAWTTITDKDGAAAAVRTAAKAAKGVPVVYVGAIWCGPCKVYKASLDDPRMVQAHRPVHIIELDADKHATALQELSISPGGVPHWEMVDKNGGVVGKKIDGGAWKENTVENMAPALTKFFTAG